MDYIVNHFQLTEGIETLTSIALIIELLFGALNCFFGYRLLKVWIAICGFLIGSGVGFFIMAQFTADRTLVFGVTAVAGVVAGVLAYEVYLVGAFFLGWIMTVSAVTVLGRSLEVDDKTKLAVFVGGIILGIVVGALIVRFARPCIIALTSISGGLSAASAAFSLVKIDQPAMIVVAAGIIAAILGMIVQFMTTPSPKS